MEDYDWDRLIDQLKSGNCTPFLGAGACRPTLPTSSELSEILAKEFHYPFKDGRTDLSRVAQYVATLNDRVTVKEYVAELIKEAAYPDFSDGAEPHALLAELDLPVYLTTNYDDFMVRALGEAEKSPHRAICRWWETKTSDAQRAADNDYIPSVDRPIVYHLHGSCAKDVETLVLTEQDYLDFLTNLNVDRGKGETFLPTSISHSLLKPLLFIGYSLQDWTFLVIFHGLLKAIDGVRQRQHVSVQLRPELNTDAGARDRAEAYLNAYFRDWKVSVFWGEAGEFCTKLRGKLE